MAKQPITADKIKNLLSVKHSKDVFVTECKNGPSYGGGLRMMDAWAMKRSWAKPCFCGYEIKVSRPDFLSDTKWPDYLPLCNEFSFVCPSGVINPGELSKDVGLLIVSTTGTRLFTKKKAPYRIIETPEELLLYILMARSRIVGSSYYAEREINKEYWERWLGNKKANLELGTRCSEKLRKSYQEQVYEVQRKMKVIQREMESYKPIKEICKELKLNPYTCIFKETFRQQIKNLQQLIPPEILTKCESLQKQLGQFIADINSKSGNTQTDNAETKTKGGCE